MKCLVKLSTILLFAPLLSFAGWQVAKPSSPVSDEPFFQAGMPQNNATTTASDNINFPDQFADLGRSSAIYAISVHGSLKENIERIMDRYHWKVIWKVPYDYNFDGRISGSSLPNVMEKLLNPFPLQATLYISNRTMIVTSRTL